MNTKATKWILSTTCIGYLLFCFLCYYTLVFSNKKPPHFVESEYPPIAINSTYPTAIIPTYPTAINPTYPTAINSSKLLNTFHEPFSKDLIVHTAFFDSRPRDGHMNRTVIFMTVNKTILDEGWIVGCAVDGRNATNFTMYSGLENYLMHDWLGEKPFLYENMRVHCYDMPGTNGSEVHVVYKTGPSSPEIRETSQHPLFFPAPRVTPTGKYNFTTVTCSKIHNRKASFIHEFVQYQKTLGVDHVHFSILDHFITDKGFDDLIVKDSFLWKQYKEGYLSFSVWKEWYADSDVKGGELSLHSEILRKVGCIYRYIGTYDYAMPLDTDDFFVPRIPGKTQLKDYILKLCFSKPAASCQFDWIWYFPSCGLTGDITDGNVTDHLKTKRISKGHFKNYKSVHNTKVFLDSSFHDARCSNCLAPGYSMVYVSSNVAYVAHNRYGQSARC